MEQFYGQWLKKFAENRQKFVPSKEGTEQQGGDDSQNLASQELQHLTDIVYENDSLKLIVEKSSFKKQKNFRLQDHLFKFKVIQKQARSELPLLSELFDFLHAALLHVLESVKTFYNKEEHNIAYLTLHQEPMVNGLNTGGKKCMNQIIMV